MTAQNCGCGSRGHAPGCPQQQDEFPGCRAAIRHPSHAPTRRHLAANPLPQQKNRRPS